MSPWLLIGLFFAAAGYLFGPPVYEAMQPGEPRRVTVTYIARDAGVGCPDVRAQPSGGPLVPLR